MKSRNIGASLRRKSIHEPDTPRKLQSEARSMNSGYNPQRFRWMIALAVLVIMSFHFILQLNNAGENLDQPKSLRKATLETGLAKDPSKMENDFKVSKDIQKESLVDSNNAKLAAVPKRKIVNATSRHDIAHQINSTIEINSTNDDTMKLPMSIVPESQAPNISVKATHRNATKFNATTMNDTRIIATELKTVKVNASMQNENRINATKMNATELKTTKLNAPTLNATNLNDIMTNASEIKSTTLNNTALNETMINRTEIKPMTLNNSKADATILNEIKVNATHLNGTLLVNTSQNGLSKNMVQAKGTMNNSGLNNARMAPSALSLKTNMYVETSNDTEAFQWLEKWDYSGPPLFIYLKCDAADSVYHDSVTCSNAQLSMEAMLNSTTWDFSVLAVNIGRRSLWKNNIHNLFRTHIDFKVKHVPTLIRWLGNHKSTDYFANDLFYYRDILKYMLSGQTFINRTKATMPSTKEITLHSDMDTILTSYNGTYPLYIYLLSGRLPGNNRAWCPYCRLSEIPVDYSFQLHAPTNAVLVKIIVADTYGGWKSNSNKFKLDNRLSIHGVPRLARVFKTNTTNHGFKIAEYGDPLDNLSILKTYFELP